MRKILILLALLLAACSNGVAENRELEIVTTNFPLYDFTKQIVGDKIKVTQILPHTTEPHAFEPTKENIRDISNCDMFVYLGGWAEPWVEKITWAIDNDPLMADASIGIKLINLDGQEYDSHIWLDPVNAARMVTNIFSQICQLDPLNREYYNQNFNDYVAKLDSLHKDSEQMFKNTSDRKVFLADKCSFTYLFDRYSLECMALCQSCKADEPVGDIDGFIAEMVNSQAHEFYYSELGDEELVRYIQQETGATPKLLYSMHTMESEKVDADITFFDRLRLNILTLSLR